MSNVDYSQIKVVRTRKGFTTAIPNGVKPTFNEWIDYIREELKKTVTNKIN